MIDNIESVLSKHDFLNLIKNSPAKLCLVDFYADWCEPCKWLSELLDEIIPEISSHSRVIKLNIDKSPELKSAFQINSVPVLMLFKNESMVWRINGFLSAPELIKKVKSFSDE